MTRFWFKREITPRHLGNGRTQSFGAAGLLHRDARGFLENVVIVEIGFRVFLCDAPFSIRVYPCVSVANHELPKRDKELDPEGQWGVKPFRLGESPASVTLARSTPR